LNILDPELLWFLLLLIGHVPRVDLLHNHSFCRKVEDYLINRIRCQNISNPSLAFMRCLPKKLR
jgi:hypothetical protein